IPTLRGGPEVLDQAGESVRGAVDNLRAVYEILAERGLADRLILDLGLVRELGYYTGAVFEIYDPAVGFTLGGGGRYDDLLGRFGITGKDVLLEQAGREVYELLDLGYGGCRMIVAARDGDDPFGEGFRRRGMVRIATKYPRIASDYFASTGRQAEIVEVKGSV